jgi:hypothetical protein
LGSLLDDRVSGKGSRATYPSALPSDEGKDEAYMGVSLGGNVDAGVGPSHTPENVRVTLLT